jgi:hypothetical protein
VPLKLSCQSLHAGLNLCPAGRILL